MRISVAAVGLLMLASGLFAQNEPAPKVLSTFRVDVAVNELEQGKRVSTRNYNMLVQDNSRGRVRLGNKVPVTTGNSTQFMDVGLNLECGVHERESQIATTVEVQISGIDPSSASAQPTIQHVSSNTTAALDLGKATPVLMMDDPLGKKRYEVVVTLARVK